VIYEKPVKALMHDFARERLKSGQVFSKAEPVQWFAERFPKIKRATVMIHVDAMSVNAANERKHHRSVRPGSGHDLFFKLGKDQYRLWNREGDPPPVYAETMLAGEPLDGTIDYEAQGEDGVEPVTQREFAFEKDLRNYLSKNLHLIEPGLQLYEDEGVSGLEYPAGGRFIDILAVDKGGHYVVVELKVSRGYERTIGQILRYMGWIRQNLSAGEPVRGVIVASSISDDLKIAASLVADLSLAEYELSLTIRQAN